MVVAEDRWREHEFTRLSPSEYCDKYQKGKRGWGRIRGFDTTTAAAHKIGYWPSVHIAFCQITYTDTSKKREKEILTRVGGLTEARKIAYQTFGHPMYVGFGPSTLPREPQALSHQDIPEGKVEGRLGGQLYGSPWPLRNV